MRTSKSYFHLIICSSLVFNLMIAHAAGQTESILYNFTSNGPQTGVVFDSAGNLYGSNPNFVYELVPQSGGTWSQKTLYTFPTGVNAEGTLIFDSVGNLYGGTLAFTDNAGTVFELSPSSGGAWTQKTIYTFPPTGVHGNSPYGSLLFDAAGNLYGTTFYGGAFGGSSQNTPGGTAFELVRQSNGGWTQKLLHSFGNGSDGYFPYAGLIMDSAGNLYGTCTRGGAYGNGTVFELSHQPNGAWKEKILHNFGQQPNDGAAPYAGLVFDSVGNLYGTATGGGLGSNGTVFELIPQASSMWKEKVLFYFGGGGGIYPSSAPIFDSAGNLYGATFSGGLYGGGLAYELIPRTTGQWLESAVHNFGNGTDGSGSLGSVTFNASGNLFGTTQAGGTSGEGTVWEVAP